MKTDWGTRTVVLIFGIIPGLVILAWLLGMIIGVLLFGEGSACPQNSCQ